MIFYLLTVVVLFPACVSSLGVSPRYWPLVSLVNDDRSGFSNSAIVPQWWFERVKNVTSQCSTELSSLRGNPNPLELNCYSNWLPKQGYHITTNPVYVLTSKKNNRFLIDESDKQLLDFLSPDVKFFRVVTGSNHSAFYDWHVEFPESVARNIDRSPFYLFMCNGAFIDDQKRV